MAVKNPDVRAVLRDYAKLMELGVDQKFVEKLDANQAKELLKGILYVRAVWEDDEGKVQ
ncbi:hypothetical protein NTE_00185 [Candidatus Nitrososphaera evergladensis SR1]|jgi:hypothetical protein|uniref:Uncharacterized protein n=1 Tax=Candidatus Nitrososphaera evergladensis SR1 TaxID=1459636 RepID=A0A075MN90_9ARCH|nr:hypothetical protein [Candidatus Nitrososphaera evergladensis]AIF82267.1 hypothetical protein NTE_00185 [Candidatus Nitrososphaera evergladensis SR1]